MRHTTTVGATVRGFSYIGYCRIKKNVYHKKCYFAIFNFCSDIIRTFISFMKWPVPCSSRLCFDVWSVMTEAATKFHALEFDTVSHIT